jgi:hypothetical protein
MVSEHNTSQSEGKVTDDNSNTSSEWPRLTHPTAHSDPRVDVLISALQPINPDTTSDQPRIPIRAELLRQLSQLVRGTNGFEMEDWIATEFREQEQRDRLWQTVQDSLQVLKEMN